MLANRHPRGSPHGGRFAPSGRPDAQVPSGALSLSIADEPTATKPSKAEARAFFDEITYMASIGPEIESMVSQRSRILKDHAAKAQAMHEANDLMFLPGDDPAKRDRLTAAASDACEEARTLSDNLFSMLDGCLSEGGTKELYARQALRTSGLQVRRVKSPPPHYPIGVIAKHTGLYRYNFNLWMSGRYQAGLSLTPIKRP